MRFDCSLTTSVIITCGLLTTARRFDVCQRAVPLNSEQTLGNQNHRASVWDSVRKLLDKNCDAQGTGLEPERSTFFAA
jgi:hypothetical protein